MKHYIKYIFYALLLSLLPIAATSCEDDLDFRSNVTGEGEAVISAEVTFKPLVSALGSRAVSGGTPGDAIKNIDQLWVVIFDSKGKPYGEDKGYGSGIYLIKSETSKIIGYTEKEDEWGTSSDALPSPNPDGQHQAESKTLKATFPLPVSLPYGNYRMYTVANVDLSKYAATISSSENPAETLKSIQLTWNSDNIAANNQMFGYFTTTEDNTSKGFDAPLITIASKTVNLRAWLKRAASKVTVAFDARNLKENIYIYLKSVEIKDIPATCWLGKENPGNPGSPGDKGAEIDYAPYNKNTQIITYHDAEGDVYTPEIWPEFISSGHPIYGAASDIIQENPDMKYDELIRTQHGENVTALYFYENMQGEGVDGTMSDKRQQVKQADRDNHATSYPDGVNSDNAAWKDAKPYGTYIEVKAYYFSNNTGDPGQGEITYRFMLGKDTHIDYNAERNHHYKLTMKFNGYANDVDFHIDYEDEDRPLDAPNPYYISYLYNHSMMLPLSFDTGEATVTSIKAEIVDNNWAPLNAKDAWTTNTIPGNDDYALYWGVGDVLNNRPYNGFLSLRKTNQTVITGSMPFTKNSNETYYNDQQRGNIEYTDIQPTPDKTIEEALEAGTLHVVKSEKNGNNHYTVHMPLWTRAKQLIKQTAYTGNNPYVAYQREAKIKVTVTLSNGQTLTSGLSNNDGEISNELISIRQVRRVVNPKGIYRKGNNKNPFRVVLKILPDEESTSFTSLISQGPWRAYVMRDTKRPKNGKDSDGTIHLTGNSETTTTGKITINDRDPNTPPETYETIEGKTGSFIDFNVNFNGVTTDEDEKSNYAVIRVEYNNYTCYHLIFVRQGYGADALLDNGDKWMTRNNVSQSKFADNPLDEGSLFKFGSWTGIKASSNKNSRSPWTKVTPNDFKNNTATELQWTDSVTAGWSHVTPTDASKIGVKFGEQEGYRVAEIKDYMALYNSPDIEQGYGVLYGDGSNATLDNIEDVYGYMYSDNISNRGMRGCFVYNYKTGKNLFFPIGASGYGHRMNSLSGVGNNIGVLRYSCSRWRIGYFPNSKIMYDDTQVAYEEGVNDAPLFFDLFRRPGGIYWVGTTTTDPLESGTLVGWDFNYFTFDFYPISSGNVQNGADACFVRSIKL